MFNREYAFTGLHADRVRRLTDVLSEESKAKLFNRNLDVYLIAPIVGLLYGRQSEVSAVKGINPTKIWLEQLTSAHSELRYNYALVMLSHYSNKLSIQERLDKAFRFFNTDQAGEDEAVYESYVRGGIDVLYEKLFNENELNDQQSVARRLMDFLLEFDNRYNQSFDELDMDKLLQAARDF